MVAEVQLLQKIPFFLNEMEKEKKKNHYKKCTVIQQPLSEK